jgi:hypothetical protein
MKAISRLLTSALIVLILISASGCSLITRDNSESISKPENLAAPIKGTWEIYTCISVEKTLTDTKDDPAIGRKIAFSKDRLLFGDNVYENVSYKIKRVNAEEYFLYQSQKAYESMRTENNELLVITAYSDDKFIYEFVKNSNGGIAISIDGQHYAMKKISDEYLNNIDNDDHIKGQEVNAQNELKENDMRSGLLLGVRVPYGTDDGVGDYTYGTYWISYVDEKPEPILYADDIYLPRMDGFWKMWIEKILNNEGVEDIIGVTAVKKSNNEHVMTGINNVSDRVETKSRKAVIYVGNDYVCVENYVYQNTPGGRKIRKTLQTLPIDNIDNSNGIKISDLAGDSGTIAMESAIEQLRKGTEKSGIKIVNREPQEENFALYRKTGHWFFKGRLNYEVESELEYVDFGLNLIPPSNMVAYDILQVPWTKMKEKLPKAVDIYTSPNKDLAVVLTSDKLMLYKIEGSSLADEPMSVISLADGSQVIMAEWATGDYVDSWSRSFTKNNKITIIEKNN